MSNTLSKFKPTVEPTSSPTGGRLSGIRERVHQPFFDTFVRGVGSSSLQLGSAIDALVDAVEVEDTVRVEEE